MGTICLHPEKMREARALANELSAHDDGSVKMRRMRHQVAVRLLAMRGQLTCVGG